MKRWTVAELRAGADAEEVVGRGSLPVVLFESTIRFSVMIELADPDPLGYRAAFLIDDDGGTMPIDLGYLAPGEGRWALRDLVLAELVGRFPTRPECADTPCDSKLRAATSALGVADTWHLLVHGRCHIHWKEYNAASDGDDLVPIL